MIFIHPVLFPIGAVEALCCCRSLYLVIPVNRSTRKFHIFSLLDYNKDYLAKLYLETLLLADDKIYHSNHDLKCVPTSYKTSTIRHLLRFIYNKTFYFILHILFR